MKYNFKFKKYVGNIGYYSMLDIEINTTSDGALQYTFDAEFVDEEWRTAVLFAVEYIYQHFKNDTRNGFSLNIRRLHTMSGDTAFIVVVYTVINCIANALNYDAGKELVYFDEGSGTFMFKK